MKSQMKKTVLILFGLLLICSLNVMAKKDRVERGMTKQQVEDLLGRPANMSFDDNGETWEYLKSGGIISGYTRRIVVFFGRDNLVRACQSSTIVDDANAPLGCGRRPGGYPMPPMGDPGYCGLSEESFSLLYNKVRDASFDSNRYDLLEVASLGCWFSCRQVAGLLKLFSFSDGKLKALQILAPRMVDPENAADVYGVFDFSSDKDKAAEMLRRR